ncbi:MAG TPA: 5'-methylthioadenosine/adenosylhomocysteine nucleosidase [Actinomycetaceae bacterium]|nr:5'-methylthioadenosine/adenosylhomocysteine nucleosidase [Actinomycetaceae bacterium]
MNEKTIEVVAVAAMKEEAAPFLAGAHPEKVDIPIGEAWYVNFAGQDVIVVVSGAGLVNAVMAATHAVNDYKPRYLVSTGSAGGLAQGIFVGDVVVGTRYSYANADATAFGYELGQIPGMPPLYEADQELVSTARSAHIENQRIRAGMIVSSDTFVDSRSVGRIRKDFPSALAADMESTALAQLAYRHELPFVSVRAISDLCGHDAGADFRITVDEVAERSAAVLRHLVGTLPHD